MTVEDAQHFVRLKRHGIVCQRRQYVGLHVVDLIKDKQAFLGSHCVKEHNACTGHRIDPIDELLRCQGNHMRHALVIEQGRRPNLRDHLHTARDVFKLVAHRPTQARIRRRQLVAKGGGQTVCNTSQAISSVENAQEVIGDLHRVAPCPLNDAMGALVVRLDGTRDVAYAHSALAARSLNPTQDVFARARKIEHHALRGIAIHALINQQFAHACNVVVTVVLTRHHKHQVTTARALVKTARIVPAASDEVGRDLLGRIVFT